MNKLQTNGHQINGLALRFFPTVSTDRVMPTLLEKYSTEILETVWDSALIGVCVVSQDGRFLESNQTFCRMIEYTNTELKQLTYPQVTIDSDIKNDMKSAQLVAEGVIASYDMYKTYITKTNRELHARLRVLSVKDERDQFVFFVSQVMPDVRTLPEIDEKPPNPFFWLEKIPIWSMVLAVLGAVAVIVAEVIKRLSAS